MVRGHENVCTELRKATAVNSLARKDQKPHLGSIGQEKPKPSADSIHFLAFAFCTPALKSVNDVRHI
jgi:hypothetical protein